MKNTDKKGFIILISIIAIAVILSIAGMISTSGSSNSVSTAGTSSAANDKSSNAIKIFKSSSKKAPKGQYLAKLYITGTIEKGNDSYNQKWLLETIDELEKDSNNMGIILFIDSPGGTVYEADEVYLRLLEYGKKKKVFAYFASMAASGAYYIACASDYIMANRNTLTGSIGVITGQFVDITGLMEKYGVKAETIHSGKNKTMGSMTQKFTDEQRAIMQAISDECYEQFTGIVAESRKLPIEKVKRLADGRIYTAKQAKENQLIDEIGDWKTMLDKVAESAFDNKYYDVYDYKYEPEETLYHYIMGVADKIGGAKADYNTAIPKAVMDVIEPNIQFPAYYYKN